MTSRKLSPAGSSPGPFRQCKMITSRRQRCSGPVRHGAATVETALVLGVWLLLLLGTLDLGIIMFRNNFVHHLANSAARLAAVHGSNSAPEVTPWGPTTLQVGLDQPHPVTDILRPLAGGLPPAEFQVRMEWPDGGNRFDDRVRVTVTSSPATALASFLPGDGTVSLQSVCIMRISH